MSWRSRLESALNVRASQVVRRIWLAFTALALSLAVPGIPRYFDLLRQPCSGSQCFRPQLTIEAAQAWVASGETLLFYAILHVLGSLTIDALLLSTAAFLIWRKADNRAATVAAFVGTALATSTLSQALAHTDPRFWLPAQGILFVQIAGLLPLFCLVPDGRFQPHGMRWVAIAYVVASFVSLTPRYRDSLAPGATGSTLWLGFVVISVLIVVATLFYRFRHAATSVQQEQMLWVLAGIGLAAPVVLLKAPLPVMHVARHPFGAIPSGMEMDLIAMFLAVGSITCMLVALVHYEPLDVDVLINRSLVYAALTTFVIGVYVVIVGYLSTVFSSDNVLISLIATGLVAVLFQPLRDRLQHAVNRLMYGERDKPYAVIAHLGERLQAALTPDTVLPTIVETVSEGLKLPHVAIVFTSEATGAEVVIAVGERGSNVHRLPLLYQGATVGYLLVSPRSGEASLSHTDQRLLADLAKQAGPVVHGVRLMTDLQQMTVELQRSRERLVLAREEERRRLRRDLHDELAPSLAGLSLTAGTIKSVARSDPGAVEALATELHISLRRAVGDIRRLVYDLRPPALDDLGLVAAIQERAAQFSAPAGASSASEAPLQVTIDLPAPLPPLPAALEVAAYRIVQEALMNVVRHAHASRCHIRIVVGNGGAQARRLELAIVDDGVGIDAARRAGVGLRSMRERAEEVGGTCEVGQTAEHGTRVFVQLPIGTEERHEHAAHPDR